MPEAETNTPQDGSAKNLVIDAAINEVRAWRSKTDVSNEKFTSPEDINLALLDFSGGAVKYLANFHLNNYVKNSKELSEDTGIDNINNLDAKARKQLTTVSVYSSSINRLKHYFLYLEGLLRDSLYEKRSLEFNPLAPLDLSVNQLNRKDKYKGAERFIAYYAKNEGLIAPVADLANKLSLDFSQSEDAATDANVGSYISQFEEKVSNVIAQLEESGGVSPVAPVDLTWYRYVCAGGLSEAIAKVESGASIEDVKNQIAIAVGYLEAYFYLHFTTKAYQRPIPSLADYIAAAAEAVLANAKKSEDLSKSIVAVSGKIASNASRPSSGVSAYSLDRPINEEQAYGDTIADLSQSPLESLVKSQEKSKEEISAKINSSTNKILEKIKASDSNAFAHISASPAYADYVSFIRDVLKQKDDKGWFYEEVANKLKDALTKLFPEEATEFDNFESIKRAIDYELGDIL